MATLAPLVSALPALAQALHENPDTAPLVYDGVSLFRKYSATLDQVLAKNATGVEALREQAQWANVPSAMRDAVNVFMSSSHSLAGLLPTVEADMEGWKTMVAQFRPDDAVVLSTVAARDLSLAHSYLSTMESMARHTWQSWRSETTTENDAITSAYKEVEDKLLRLRRQVDLLGEVSRSLVRQNEAVAAVASGNLTKLEELKKLLAQESATPQTLARLEQLKGLLLRSTSVSLSIEPTAAFVGDSVEFRGKLTSGDRLLQRRKVTVTVAGAPESEVLTDSRGAFQGRVALPYQYVSEMALQAVYYPQGEDIGLYLGSSSPIATIKVLYYPAQLNLEAPGNAYPGRMLGLHGSLDYGDSPAPPGRNLLVYWDGRVVLTETATAAFDLGLPMAADMSLGKHAVILFAPPQGRYAPVSVSAEVEVIRVTPIIDVGAPTVILLPFTLNVRGKVYSPLGPLQDTPLTIAVGDWETTTRSAEDGAFSARLRTGMSLTLMGSQELRVSVAPAEPWYRAGSKAASLLVINPVSIAGLALVLALPVFFSARRFRRRTLQAPAAVPPPPAPVLVGGEASPHKAEPASDSAGGSPRAILIALYRGALMLVQRLTAVVLQPSHTLREFAQECGPGLGPLAGHFQEFTLMMERLLYSRRRPDQADAARGLELRRRLEEGTKGEGA